MNRGRVLISGAGVAGCAMAYWLGRAGYETVVVERAAALREGGQAVDFRGPVHRAVLGRMQMWDDIHAQRTNAGDLRLVNARDKTLATLPALMMAGDVEILRGDLVRLLHDRSRRDASYRFADRITGIEDRGDAVAVEFERAPAATFDFLIGADGLHSATRAMAVASEPSVLRHHGYRIASFQAPNLLGGSRGAASYCEPGRGVMLSASSSARAHALLVYASTDAPARATHDSDAQKSALLARFSGMGWRVPALLAALRDAKDLYVDDIATVHPPAYSKGRVVLLGDAAYGGTLGGQGTSLSIVGSYVLANELARAETPARAFANYEALMRPYATGCQRGALRVGQFFAPRTQVGVALRNLFYAFLTSRPMARTFERIVKSSASKFTLPEYA